MAESGKRRQPREIVCGTSSRAQTSLSRPLSPTYSESLHSSLLGGYENNSTASSKSKKKGRGMTRGIGFAKKVRNGQKGEANIPKELMQLVGDSAQEIITECGIIVRQYAPLQVSKWKQIEYEGLESMRDRVQSMCHLPKDSYVQGVIDDQLRRSYNTYRHTLHLHFKKFSSPEEAKNNPYVGVSRVDWDFFVSLFTSENYKKISEINKKNKAKQMIKHCAGTKSFSRIRWEKRDLETGELLDPISLWKDTHYHESNGGWVDEASQVVYEKVTSLGQDEETMHMTNEEKLAHTLGTKSGYVCGLGSGPKPKSTKYLDYYREQVDKEVSERVKSLWNEMQAGVDARVQEQLAEVRSEIQTQMRVEMQAEMQAFQTSFLQRVKNMGFSFTQVFNATSSANPASSNLPSSIFRT